MYDDEGQPIRDEEAVEDDNVWVAAQDMIRMLMPFSREEKRRIIKAVAILLGVIE